MIFIASLLLLCSETFSTNLYGSQVGSSCSPFVPGAACQPHSGDKPILTNSTKEECIGACEAQNSDGCCWHSPQTGECEWCASCSSFFYGDPSVREATNCTTGAAPSVLHPEQIHIAFGPNVTSIVISWANKIQGEGNFDNVSFYIRYGLETSDPKSWKTISDTVETIRLGDYLKHRVSLVDLSPNSKYNYAVGQLKGDYPLYEVLSNFRTQREDTNWSPRLALFGDLGWTNDQICSLLGSESFAGDVDAIILYGDMIYWADGESENSFMRDVSLMSGNGSVPFHVSPGNGDSRGNFSIYKANFAMPGYNTFNSLWHSFDIGHAHIIGISTEAFYYQTSVVQENMMKWLEDDLRHANTRTNRALRPWIIMHYHRPAYSTNYDGIHGDQIARFKFEPLCMRFGVDVVFSGHVHNQERTFPVFNGSVVNSTDPNDPYHNALGPVNIVSGNPSNAEGTNVFSSPRQSWTAFRSLSFGYTHLNVVNSTMLYIDVISPSLGGAIIDDVYITKDSMCSFGSECGEKINEEKRRRILRPQFNAKTRKNHENRHKNAQIRTQSQAIDSKRFPNTPRDQIDALWSIYEQFGGLEGRWTRSYGWSKTADPCDPDNRWFGVGCVPITDVTMPNLYDYDLGGITALVLPGNGLHGDISKLDLSPLLNANLQILELSDNELWGVMPSDIWNGRVLHTLFIDSPDGNIFRINGSLPGIDANNNALANLKHLSLVNQKFAGVIPKTFYENLRCTETYVTKDSPACDFWLNGNDFVGNISEAACDVQFNELYLANNSGISCKNMPCIRAAYYSIPSACSKSDCTPCS